MLYTTSPKIQRGHLDIQPLFLRLLRKFRHHLGAYGRQDADRSKSSEHFDKAHPPMTPTFLIYFFLSQQQILTTPHHSSY